MVEVDLTHGTMDIDLVVGEELIKRKVHSVLSEADLFYLTDFKEDGRREGFHMVTCFTYFNGEKRGFEVSFSESESAETVETMLEMQVDKVERDIHG